MTEISEIVRELREACSGHPHAKIAWPHRLLHRAADALERLSAKVAQTSAVSVDWQAEAEECKQLAAENFKRAKVAEAQVELLESNARIQGKLLADMGRAKEAAEAEKDDLLKANAILHGLLTNSEARLAQIKDETLRMVVGMFEESVHETYTKDEVMSIVEDMISLGRPVE